MTDILNDENEIRQYTFSEMQKSFAHHYQNCQLYRQFCDLHQFTPPQLTCFADLYNIPQIPTAIFKSLAVCSVDQETCKCCTSSGTKGYVSRIYRDGRTIRAFLDSIVRDLDSMYGLTPENCIIYNLGPSEEEAGDIWIAYVTGFLKHAFETYQYMHAGILETARFIQDLQAHPAEKRIALLGAPILFMKVFEYMERSGTVLHLPESALIFTAGGWKSKSGEALPRDILCAKFNRYFGTGQTQYFDVYNQVESNTPFFECRCGGRHVPAGYLVIARDPVTLKALPDSEEGVISFLDSSANSYPAFVITDDIGSVTTGCRCGYKGQVFHYGRRVKSVESKGCAIKLDQKIV